MKRIGILVVSDRAAKGEYPDLSGPTLKDWALQAGFKAAAFDVIPDEQELVQAKLTEWSDLLRLDLILTSGGTGLSPRDVTPEATLSVIERQAQGIPEYLRTATGAGNPKAALSRAVAGLRGRTLIVNLPGSPEGMREWLGVLSPLLPHALEMIEGKGHEHGPTTCFRPAAFRRRDSLPTADQPMASRENRPHA